MGEYLRIRPEGPGGARPGGGGRARSHCRFVLPLIHFTPDLLTYAVPVFLKRQCDQTLGLLWATGTRATGSGATSSTGDSGEDESTKYCRSVDPTGKDWRDCEGFILSQDMAGGVIIRSSLRSTAQSLYTSFPLIIIQSLFV